MKKKIVFKCIEIEGFSSWVTSKKFILDRGLGINIIKGSNGAGKTTIFNALYWCLYGENLKGVIQEDIPTKLCFRGVHWKGTRVVVNLHIDGVSFDIARHIAYKGDTQGREGRNSLMIFREGELQGKDLHKKDQKGYIIELLGMDAKIFTNSILFGQGMKRFVGVSIEDKRKIFESIFDMAFIDEAKEKGKAKSEELGKEYEEKRILILKKQVNKVRTESALKYEKVMLSRFEENKKERVECLKKRKEREEINKKRYTTLLKNATKEIDRLQEITKKKQNTITSIEADIKKWKEEYDSMEELILGEEKEISNIERNIKSIEAEITTQREKIRKKQEKVCNFCGQDIPVENREKFIKSLKENLLKLEKKLLTEEEVKGIHQKKIQEYREDPNKMDKEEFNLITKDLEKEKKEVNVFVSSINLMKDKGKELKIKIEQTTNNILQTEQDISKEENAKAPSKENIVELENTLKDIEIVEKAITEEMDKIDKERKDILWWVSKGYGSNGIKSYILNSLLVKLNRQITKYISIIGLSVNFSIDIEKPSKPLIVQCSVKGTSIDYAELSGGEKARVDVAVAFAIHDVVSSITDINIVILDEVFEGLDEEGKEQAFSMIRQKAENKTIFVITHSNMIDALNCSNIEIEKDPKGNTTIG